MVNTYIIWKCVNDRNVANVNDVVGLFVGTYQEADALLDKLNAADPDATKHYGYWRSEPTVLTPEVVEEIVESLKAC